MPTQPAFKTFLFKNNVRWKSGRHGVVSAGRKPKLQISSPPEFKGKPGFWSPEDLFLATVNVCLMQTFMEYALRTDLGVVSYTSDAEGMLERAEGRYRFTEFKLRPRLVLKASEDILRAQRILDSAQGVCLISNSIRATVRVFLEFSVKGKKAVRRPPRRVRRNHSDHAGSQSEALILAPPRKPRRPPGGSK